MFGLSRDTQDSKYVSKYSSATRVNLKHYKKPLSNEMPGLLERFDGRQGNVGRGWFARWSGTRAAFTDGAGDH
jgi:hypothetical protein